MLQTYRAVFRAPGTFAFAAAGFVMRMPIAMYPIGLVLIISGRTGEYGFAGVLSASYIFGAAPGNPLLARLVDRYGQRRLILPATTVTLAATVTLAFLLEADAPDWALVLPTVTAGFSYLSVGSLVRARWSLKKVRAPGRHNELAEADAGWAWGWLIAAVMTVGPVFMEACSTCLLIGDSWGPRTASLALAQAVSPHAWLQELERQVLTGAAHKPRHDNFTALAVWVSEPGP